MPVRLDDRTIKAAQASDGRRLELRDALVPGLVLRVTPARGSRPSGKKKWSVLFRLDGRPSRQTLSPWRADETRGKGFSVAQARSEAERILKAVARGENPQAAKMDRRRALTVEEQARPSSSMGAR